MYFLKDPVRNKQFAQPFHVTRLKAAYVRVPNPSQYFMDSVRTQEIAEVRTPEIADKLPANEHDQPEANDSDENHLLPEIEPEEIISDNNDSEMNDQNIVDKDTNEKRPKRTRQLPARFRDENFVYHNENNISDDSSNNIPRVKRFLAQKTVNGKTSYLAHMIGEPAQHAVWLEGHQLGPKAKAKLQSRPPPTI